MDRPSITYAIKRGLITRFIAIFKVYHYSQKAVREATGLGEKRLRLIIYHPDQAKGPEIKLIAAHLKISTTKLRALIQAQLNTASDGNRPTK